MRIILDKNKAKDSWLTFHSRTFRCLCLLGGVPSLSIRQILNFKELHTTSKHTGASMCNAAVAKFQYGPKRFFFFATCYGVFGWSFWFKEGGSVGGWQ